MWIWIVGGLVLWVLLAFGVAVVIGSGIRMADVRAADPLTAADPSVELRLRTPRRRIPLPPVAVGLAATAVLLETAGFIGRLTAATGPVARALSMDAPFSAPRTYVAALFAAAAVAAVAGALRVPGRRTWWLAVGLVCAGIAVVKIGGTVHVDAMTALSEAVGDAGAVVASIALVCTVLAVLAFVSRDERRDRRRVLTSLAAYGGASVGLSTVSALAAGQWAVTATYLEESGEALAGVAVLVAVLVGVAPRLVLPASWVLRREEDAASLAVPDAVPDRVSG
ncbi:hypothetical protein SAMN05660209_04648 [Geodermatophilus africanus]|uniref:Uncharacterized protein n=1 Tax=Geodermatophilus africanus TaxID=1137993 RepID=A0A1H3Q781_9ACTN|nr:hypothetical protein [Geodermatophilus africanus]SDZ09384.1 hypothetical protein SAMN05660209_04648 [Geodermatophilus africanus]